MRFLEAWWKGLSNFDTIKKEIEEARKKAEDGSVDTQSICNNDEGITIIIKPKIKNKIKKKAVNYYLSVELINKIKCNAEKVNMKDSEFIEKLLNQVFNQI